MPPIAPIEEAIATQGTSATNPGAGRRAVPYLVMLVPAVLLERPPLRAVRSAALSG